VIDLLNSVSSAGYCARYGAQLAVWSLAEGLSLDQISQAMGKIDPADLSLAEQLLGLTPSQPEAVELTPTLESITQEATLPAEEQDQIPNDSPIATSPPEAAAGVAISPGLLIGLVLGAVVLIAIAVTAVLTLREGKRRSPPPVQVESWDATPHKPVSPPPSAARQPLPAPVSTTAPIKPVLETGKRPATQIIEPGGIRLRLIGQSGKLAGRTFELQPPCLISRSPLQVFALEDPSLSTPHALFDAASNPPAVKDLSSTSGVLINAERIGSGFNDLPANAVITLGNCELRLAGGKLLVGSGTAAGRSLVVSGLAVVSAAPLSVIETGSAERGISDAHATLYVREGNFRIRDLKSSNGIILNGEHLVAESTIKSGDTLRLGSTDFTVEVVQ
jgi:pSer/pThr/pTyr-binding forkhead associated (FHA) protein